MNLISCDGCGVVLDLDKIKFPDLSENYALIKGEKIYPTTPFTYCPACKRTLLKIRG